MAAPARVLTLMLLLPAASAGCLGATDEALAPDTALATLPPGLTADTAGILTTPGVHSFEMIVDGEPAPGWIGIPPEGTGNVLLVLAHGLGNDVSWVGGYFHHLSQQGIIGLAMQYRGEIGTFNVRTGVEDTLAATLAVQALHPAIERTVLYGVSMGGEISGIAVAEAPPGTYDVWINGVGVMDLARLWEQHEWARPIIEAETGGTPTEVPDAYAWRSPLSRVDAIAAHGLTRAYFVYGVADFIVPLDHAEDMYDALVAAQVPVTYHLVATGRDAWVCVPPVFVVCPTLPAGPAGHEAGWTGVIFDILSARLAGEPDDDPAAVRYVREGLTGTDVRR